MKLAGYVFPFVHGAAMSTDARAAVERAARELLRALAELPAPPTLRVAEVDGHTACLIQVWDASLLMPTVGVERKARGGGRRAECREDIVAVVRDTGEPITRKEIIRALKLAGESYGPSTVAKALAELTTAGELLNSKDKKDYRLPSWRRNKTPNLLG